MPDSGISASQALNYEEVQGAKYPYAIAAASASLKSDAHWNFALPPSYNDGTVDRGAGYYMRPDYVLITPGMNCHEILFMFSGSAEEALDHETGGWVSFGSASYSLSGSNRLDISPLAWTASGVAGHGTCEGTPSDANQGSGSVIFVYNSAGRIW